MAGLTKEQKAQRVVQEASVLLTWYTAWLMAGNTKLVEGTNINEVVDEFLADDEDMVRRFFNLPQKDEQQED